MNPFYVQPGGNMTEGLAGIGDVLKDIGDQKKEREAQEADQLYKRQAQAAVSQALESGDLDQINRTAVEYPEFGDIIYTGMNAKDKDKQGRLAGHLREVVNAPPEQVESIWNKRIQQGELEGRDMTDSRRELDEYLADPEGMKKGYEVAYAATASPQEYKAWQESRALPEYESIMDAKGNIIGQKNTKTGKVESDPRAASDTLQEIYDPNSPTGSRFVQKSEALGQPGKMPAKMSASFNPETGEFNISQGGSDLTNSQKSGVQGKILSTGDTMSQIQSVKARFKPEFQQIGIKAGMAWSAMKDKINPESLSADERSYLEDFTAYKAEAGQMFSNTLKELSGAAITPAEMARAETWLPNPGSGLFDGDSPTQLQSKVQRFEDFTRKALMKYTYINKHGLTKEAVDVDEMPTLMGQRGDVLEKELEAKGLKGKELEKAVIMKLSDEFGLGVY